MRVSLSGLLQGLARSDYEKYAVNEFLEHYEMAKNSHASGDSRTVEEFFQLYVVSKARASL